MTTSRAEPGPTYVDRLTLVALAVIAYAVANAAHEGLGHGGACVLVGGTPRELNAVFFDCDEARLGASGLRIVAAGGTLVNFAAGAMCWLALRRGAVRSPSGRYLLWLLMSVSFLQGTGYWLFSGLAGAGDWAAVIDGLSPAWLYRGALVAAGAAGYALAIRLALRTLGPFVGGGDDRMARGRVLMLLPYLVGGALYCAAGALNPRSPRLVLISAAAASLGGTSAMAWSYNMLHAKRGAAKEGEPLGIPRSLSLVIAAVPVALLFVVVLGRSIRF